MYMYLNIFKEINKICFRGFIVDNIDWRRKDFLLVYILLKLICDFNIVVIFYIYL